MSRGADALSDLCQIWQSPQAISIALPNHPRCLDARPRSVLSAAQAPTVINDQPAMAGDLRIIVRMADARMVEKE
jgi:hypothetical protein